jgi:hypothetical protein
MQYQNTTIHCRLPAEGEEEDVVNGHQTSIRIWDKGHGYCYEALDRTLQDVMDRSA